MKKNISFSKTITFKTMIAEITDIGVKHTLSLKDNNEVEGDILVDGKYKMTEASNLEEEFHYKLPFVIAVDPKYNVEDLDITIDEFNFEIINEENLKVNVEIGLDGLYEKELIREEKEIPVEIEEDIEKIEFEDKKIEPLEKLDEILVEDDEKNIKKVESTNNIGSIFSSLASTEETYSTYSVYITRESDTLETIMDKYKITKEELSDYNDLENIKVGSKLIIPCHDK